MMPTEQLKRGLDAGKVVLGGCCITGDAPWWECADCQTGIHRAKRATPPDTVG
jgi:hypothetical protein